MTEQRPERLFPFRAGPIDGRSLLVPLTPNREWSIPTVAGKWVGDLDEALPENLDDVDYRHEHYLRVGDEYIQETLVTAEDEPPAYWHWRAEAD